MGSAAGTEAGSIVPPDEGGREGGREGRGGEGRRRKEELIPNEGITKG